VAAPKRLMILDEPLNRVDRPLRLEILSWLAEHARQRQRDAIFTSHDFRDVERFADSVSYLAEDGLVGPMDPSKFFLRPPSLAAARLLGYEGTLDDGDTLLAVHPRRVAVGSSPGLGPVLSGSIVGRHLEEGQWAISFVADGSEQPWTACLPADAVGDGCDRITLTLISPPRFTRSGEAAEGHFSHPQSHR
jgi:energy-coupling factor transporter ATP-binding protein EcfA2